MFNLKTNVNELESANQGSSRMMYHQIPPTRDVSNANFPRGTINFRWENAGTTWWNPSKSYFRIRCSLTKPDGSPLTLSDNIAPNMNLVAQLFQSAEFKINDKVVSRIGDYMPQIDMLETRLSKSKSWVESLGHSINFLDKDFATRQAAVCSDGQIERKVFEKTSTPTELSLTGETVAVAATGVITFSSAYGDKVKVGDKIVLDDGSTYLITGLPSATTVQANGGYAAAVVTATPNWTLVSKTNEARSVSNLELIWQCPLSVFKIPHNLPCGRYEVSFNPVPSSQYKLNVIESRGASKTAGPAGGSANYDFNVEQMYFYCLQMESTRVEDITYLLDLENLSIQSDKIDNASLQQKQFDVSPTTFALTSFFQDSRVSSDTRLSASKFHTYPVDIPLDPSPKDGYEELKLTRFYCQYSGLSLPQPDADPLYDTTTDRTVQRYLETQVNSDGAFDTGGCESIEDFHDNGQLLHQRWQKDGSDRSTRVVLNTQFDSGVSTANMNVLLASHYRSVARISIEDSRVVSVQVEDI